MPVIGHPVLPDEEELKAMFLPRFVADLKARAAELWQLSGLERKYGSYALFAGTFRASEMVDEIAVLLLYVVLLDVEDRRRSGRPVGRPRDVMAPDLAVELLRLYLRYHKAAGRRSVAISVDGKQEEAGPFFEYIKLAIEPLNRYLTEHGRNPLSPARIARDALDERRRRLRAKRASQEAFSP